MIILDSDVLSIVQRGTGEAYSRLVSRLNAMPHQPVAVTIITFEEQMRGWLAFVARAKTIERQIIAYRKLHELEDDFETRLILDFDEQAAIEYRGLLRRRLRIGTMDTKIAAIALAQRATLITRNLVDFRKVPGLDAQDWTT